MICYFQKKIKVVNTLFSATTSYKYRKVFFSYTFNLSKSLQNKQQDVCNALANVIQVKNCLKKYSKNGRYLFQKNNENFF
jgi:hypothetical protein